MEISINTRQISYNYTTAAASAAGESVFGEALKISLENKETDEKIGKGVPKDWSELNLFSITSAGYVPDGGVIERFEKTMSELGIDMDKRPEPTHEITAEQEEWLASRYDLSKIWNAPVGSEEHSNFMLDLVYLNVFSMEEIIRAQSTTIVFPPGETARLIKVDESENTSHADNFLDAILETADTLEDYLMEYIEQKYGKVEDAPDDVKEWYETYNKIVEQKREFHDILARFFAKFSDDTEQENNYDGAKLNIEYASEKLKVDFGKLAQI